MPFFVCTKKNSEFKKGELIHSFEKSCGNSFIEVLKVGHVVEVASGELRKIEQTGNEKVIVSKHTDVPLSQYTFSLKHPFSQKEDIVKIYGYTPYNHEIYGTNTTHREVLWELEPKEEKLKKLHDQMKLEIAEIIEKYDKIKEEL